MLIDNFYKLQPIRRDGLTSKLILRFLFVFFVWTISQAIKLKRDQIIMEAPNVRIDNIKLTVTDNSDKNSDEGVNEEKGFFDIASEDDSPEKILSQIVIYEPNHIDERHYKRMGFFCAVGEVTDPEIKFQVVNREQYQLLDERIAHLQELHFMANLRLQQKIELIQKHLEEIVFKWTGHVGEVSAFEIEKSKAEQRLTELRKELRDIYQSIGQKKERLIEERILAVRKELELMIENYRKVYEQRFEINKRTFEDNRNALDYKVKRFEALKTQFEERQVQIAAKVNALSLAGVNPYVANFLVAAGFAAAVVAGYFFSIFALSKHLNDENVPFFVIQGFHHFITQVFAGNSIGIQFLLLSGFLIGVILVLTVIVWGCHVMVNWSEKAHQINTTQVNDRATNRLMVEVGDSNNFSFETYAESSNFFQFWLNLVPILIITGVALILLFLGTAATNISSLDTSLTGTLVGTLLTFLMAGLVYLYLVRIVEPRNERYPERSFILNNLELVGVISIFLFCTLAMLFLKPKIDEHDPLVLVEFVSVILMVAFLLGYALRFRGLIATANFLDTRINALYDAIRDNLRPRPLNLTSAEDNSFKQEYLKLQKQLMELIQNKNEMTGYLLWGEDREWLKKKLDFPSRRKPLRWWQFWRSRNVKDENPDSEVAIKLTDIEKQMFPKETVMAKELTDSIHEVKQHIYKLEEEIKARKEEHTAFCRELKEKRTKLHNQVDNYKKAQERFRKILFDRIDGEKKYMEEIVNYLKEGFDLGMWYRVNGLGPSHDYYLPVTDLSKQNGNHE